MISTERLAKSFCKDSAVVPVLTDITVQVGSGEFVAIMGPSGSGKSTLLHLLGFLDRPDSGTYLFQGKDLSAANDDALATVRNSEIGFVFQQFHLLDRISARDNVMLPLLYLEADDDCGDARAAAALEAVGLAHRASHFPAELSGGEQQRVAIARALINNPALILADEPTGNLDDQSGADVLERLEGLRQSGRTIVLVTHDRSIAERADRILLLEHGRIG